MERLKIQDLEVGKVYRCFYKGLEHDGFYKVGNSGKLFYTDGTEWEESDIYYNEMFDITFEEIQREIDWTKVPRGTKVQVRNYEEWGRWINVYFVEQIKSTTCLFKTSFFLDDEFTGVTIEGNTHLWKYCRIHESVEIPDEWYKEVE